MKQSELDELNIMQEIFDDCPDVAAEIFTQTKLGERFLDLRNQKAAENMSRHLGEQIARLVDQQVFDDIKKMFTPLPPKFDPTDSDEVDPNTNLCDSDYELIIGAKNGNIA